MLERLKNWLKIGRPRGDAAAAPDSHGSGPTNVKSKAPPRKTVPRQDPEYVQADDDLAGDIDSNGPGKNELIRNKFVREDTGTHETLKILDDSMVDSGEEPGLDPYNTGSFDRSKNWDRRFGK